VKYLFIGSLLFLTGCSLFFTKPSVTFRELKVIDIDSRGMTLALLLNVNNPNSYEIRLDGYNFTMKILDLPLASGEQKAVVQFPGQKATDVLVPMRVTYGNVLDIVMKRPNPTSIPYQLEAGLDIVTPVGTLNFPVTTSGTIAVPRDKLKGILLKGFGESLGVR